MTLSDAEFVSQYQHPLAILHAGDEETPYFLIGNDSAFYTLPWYPKALDAITRLVQTGLIQFAGGGNEKNFSILCTSPTALEYRLAAQNSRPDEVYIGDWDCVLFAATSAGNAMAEKYGLRADFSKIVPGFREELTRIFDEHGVGFDAELPYKMRF